MKLTNRGYMDRAMIFMPKCIECGRTFDLFDENESNEWHYGHDC